MTKQSTLFAWAVGALAAVALAQSAPSALAQVGVPQYRSHAIGAVHIGMTQEEVQGVARATRTLNVSMAGGAYVKQHLAIRGGPGVDVLFADGHVSDISTTDRDYETPEGAHVGDSLATLRSLYPDGHVHSGYDPQIGPFFNFETGAGGQFFAFETTTIPDSCLLRNTNCPNNLDSKRAIMLYVR